MTDDLPTDLEGLGHRFDFGEYEIEAYLAVLEYGNLTASEIAEKTDIPQPRVYDTVRSLADNGFVEIRESRPIEVLAIDPDEAFGSVQTALEELIDDLEQRYRAPSREAEAVSLVTSRQTIIRYLEDIITSADYELMLSLTPDLLARFEDSLAERRNAGVSIELLLSPSTEVPDTNSYDYARVSSTTRTRAGLTTPIVAVADGSYSAYTGRKALQAGGDQYAVIFNRSELGFLVSGFLNTVVWPSSTVLDENGQERPFPRRYATIRRCVRDISTNDCTLYATVNGRDVATGEFRTVAGEIIDFAHGTGSETASITIESDCETFEIGGQAAALEDIEAYELAIDRDAPPEL